jgi:hypothetical protein
MEHSHQAQHSHVDQDDPCWTETAYHYKSFTIRVTGALVAPVQTAFVWVVEANNFKAEGCALTFYGAGRLAEEFIENLLR